MPTTTPCGTCGADATHQWGRHATDNETATHLGNLQRNIRESNSGRPDVDYAQAPRPVVQAVYGCDDHQMPADKAGIIHAATCVKPDGCTCPVS